MKVLYTTLQKTIEVETTLDNILDAVITINQKAPKSFNISADNGVLKIEHNKSVITVSASYITEIWVGDGWVRIETESVSSVTLFEFGEIKVNIF